MDVNATRFHLLLGQEDWAPLILGASPSSRANLYWDEEHDSLGLRPRLFRFPTPPKDRPPRPEDRRGAARDRYGNWYWIAENGTEYHFRSLASHRATYFWSAKDLEATCEAEQQAGGFRPQAAPAPPPPWPLSGLAVTRHHYLVVGVLDPQGVLIFDLHAGGPPTLMRWPEQVPFAPFDMATAPGGGVWILDRRERRYWALDRRFRVVTADQGEKKIAPPPTDDFGPACDAPRRWPGVSFPTGIKLEMASPVEAQDPISIVALPDGSVLILDSDVERGYSIVYHYHYARQLGYASLEKVLSPYLDEEAGGATGGPQGVWGQDMAFVLDLDPDAAPRTGTLYVVASDGNQTFAFRLRAGPKTSPPEPGQAGLELELLTRYYPMRLYSGKALAAVGQEVYYDLQDRWLKLVEQPRRRYRTTGALETEPLDGKEPDCVWHRLYLDACVPNGTQVTVESRAANDKLTLAQMPWHSEPRPYRRHGGSELPYTRAFAPSDLEREESGTWELLLQSAPGAYLQLRLALRGNGRSTPRLRALRATYPRFSYLREYLPAAYRYDTTSASFLDRYLANVEGMYTALEGRIAAAQALFDVRTVPAEYLEWLAGWFGVALEADWDETRRRLFLAHAIELYNQRGTLSGLIRAIRLATDDCPDDSLFEGEVLECRAGRGSCASQAETTRQSVRIVERFLTRSTPGVVLGDPGQATGPGVTQAFSAWSPDQGAEPLHREYRTHLQSRYEDLDDLNQAWETGYTDWEQVRFPPVTPSNAAKAEDWRSYLQAGLGFTYAAVGASDQKAYQAFLARRYQHIGRLNDAYRLAQEQAPASFESIVLPAENDMPTGGTRLYDWIQFVSLVLPIRRQAHRFSVLVPTGLGTDSETLSRRLALVRRVVELEKPVHTDFEVRSYWALFRVGEVRLGLDTLLGTSSRFVAVVLGQGYLAEGYLQPPHPWDVGERVISDRDRLGQMPSL